MTPPAKLVGKQQLLKQRMHVDVHKHLCFFGKHELTNEMIYSAEQFLLRCISNEKLDSFDNLGYVYHKKLLEFDLEMFLATSSTIKQHILRAYLQCHLWLHALNY